MPLLQGLTPGAGRGVQVLVLTPTRELTLQVAASFKALGRFAPAPPKALAVIGGEPVEQQIAALRREVAILVATPGRLVDLLGQGEIDLSQVRTLVLDEADRLLELGFSEELAVVLGALPAERQTLLFTATLPRVSELAHQVLRDPVELRVTPEQPLVEEIHQRAIQVDRDRRRALLQHLIQEEGWRQTLVFVATQRAAENLAAKLRRASIPASALHGGLDQTDRAVALRRFKRGTLAVLVATDLAARGIDIPALSAVVNYDLPRSPRDYVHRIGRTGRAGLAGTAISLVDHHTEAHLRVIERKNKIRLPREQVPGFELTGEPPPRIKGQAPVKGRRKSKKDKLREAAAAEALAEGAP